MEVDIKKLDTAITYLQRLAEGHNPINNQSVEGDSVLNNPNVIRCMFFVKEVLEKVRANDGRIDAPVRKKERKSVRALDAFPVEILSKFKYREDKSIAKLLIQIYEPLEDKSIRKISGKTVNDWLLASGYIMEVYNEELKSNTKVPTEKGEQIGLRAERIEYPANVYIAIYYNKQAQEFLIRNFEKLLNGEIISE